MKKNQINWWVVTWIFISSITLLRFWYISRIPLSADEAYFWVCSRHLSLCYYDQPPMVPYLIFLSTKIGRNSELWVRFFSPLCIAITGIILYNDLKLLLSVSLGVPINKQELAIKAFPNNICKNGKTMWNVSWLVVKSDRRIYNKYFHLLSFYSSLRF